MEEELSVVFLFNLIKLAQVECGHCAVPTLSTPQSTQIKGREFQILGTLTTKCGGKFCREEIVGQKTAQQEQA